jgi:K+-sensing histidine kinase KdpD
VSDLLVLLEPSGRRSGRCRQVVVLQAVLDRALCTIDGYRPARGPWVRVAVPAEPVLVYGDPDELVRMIINAVSAATASVVAADSVGIEISAGPIWSHLRVHTVAERRPVEDGVDCFGLTVTRLIARRHAGVVSVRPAPDGGRTLTVALPLAPPLPGRAEYWAEGSASPT